MAVNNKVVAELSYKVDPEKDMVEVDGEKIIPKRHVYFLLNKPRGFITSTSDENLCLMLDLILDLENTSYRSVLAVDEL